MKEKTRTTCPTKLVEFHVKIALKAECLVSSWLFTAIVGIAIVVAEVAIGLSQYNQITSTCCFYGASAAVIITLVQAIVFLVLAVEVLLNIIACGSRPWRYDNNCI